MATLVLSTVGTALGGPLGGALGSLVGQSIDQSLFGPGIRKGPRLGGLSVQTSSYGSPIPRIYGTMRVAGTVIWSTDIKEDESVEGGGKGSPEYVAYRYSASFAVALSSRPIHEVRRIWADGKLIRGAADDFKVKTKFRLVLGDEDQAIDPLIASIETIDQTPAYRGLALAIFEDLDLGEFGGRIPLLTFEVIADEAIDIGEMLRDASGGLIEATDHRPLPGYAAHGVSIGDSVTDLVELCGIQLAERDGKLRTSEGSPPALIEKEELGCDTEGRAKPLLNRDRAAEGDMPSSLAMVYYDAQRDFQSGQMQASSGRQGVRSERIELPAVLSGEQAKALVEEALARRYRRGSRIGFSLPPSRITLRPGDSIQLGDDPRTWIARSVTIDGLSVDVEAEVARINVPFLPSDPGRPVTQPDQPIGRTELILLEAPPQSGMPSDFPVAHLAAATSGAWKVVPVELRLESGPLPPVAIRRQAVVGHALSVLEARVPMIMDELSSVIVKLVDPSAALMNADLDALMAGANLALLGGELMQFGSAEEIAPETFRLSRLLRGVRGTEWAAGAHRAGEPFCLINQSIQPVDLPAEAVGTSLAAIAHGIGDAAPLPQAQRILTGEAMRPPSPCHLRLWRESDGIGAQWVRRSHRGWDWLDEVSVPDDPFAELYRVTIEGPRGLPDRFRRRDAEPRLRFDRASRGRGRRNFAYGRDRRAARRLAQHLRNTHSLKGL
jgi:hypothetical protein